MLLCETMSDDEANAGTTVGFSERQKFAKKKRPLQETEGSNDNQGN